MTYFSPAKGVKILLQLHDEFQPGLKYCFPGKKSIRMSKLGFSARAEIPFRLHGIFSNF